MIVRYKKGSPEKESKRRTRGDEKRLKEKTSGEKNRQE